MHSVGAPLGQIRGTAVIRDKDGNVKGTFEFGGDATEEQYEQLKELLKEPTDGSNSHNGSA